MISRALGNILLFFIKSQHWDEVSLSAEITAFLSNLYMINEVSSDYMLAIDFDLDI